MRNKHLILALPPAGAIALLTGVAAAGLPVLATLASVIVLLAGYGRLALGYAAMQERNEQVADASRASDAAARARRLAIVDARTDLLAQWYFELRIEEEALRCQRYEEQASLVVLHYEDEKPLTTLAAQEAAGAALRGVRETDLVGSLEDGFCLCLLHCDSHQAQQVTRRIVSRLGEGWRAGIAIIPEDNSSGKQAILVARERLKTASYASV
jgi:GGDEF domain-containing protein